MGERGGRLESDLRGLLESVRMMGRNEGVILASGTSGSIADKKLVEAEEESDAVIAREAALFSRRLTDMIFTCPHCGDPAATVEGDLTVDIHSGATYRCSGCYGAVIFTAMTPDEYTEAMDE